MLFNAKTKTLNTSLAITIRTNHEDFYQTIGTKFSLKKKKKNLQYQICNLTKANLVKCENETTKHVK